MFFTSNRIDPQNDLQSRLRFGFKLSGKAEWIGIPVPVHDAFVMKGTIGACRLRALRMVA
jgi:hypothetical protein